MDDAVLSMEDEEYSVLDPLQFHSLGSGANTKTHPAGADGKTKRDLTLKTQHAALKWGEVGTDNRWMCLN